MSNIINNKPLSNNYASSTAIGVATAGIGSSIASRIVPASVGRPATKLTYSVVPSQLSKSNVQQVKQNTVSELISNTAKSIISFVSNLFNPPKKKH